MLPHGFFNSQIRISTARRHVSLVLPKLVRPPTSRTIKKTTWFFATRIELGLDEVRGTEGWMPATDVERASFQASNIGRCVAFHQEIGRSGFREHGTGQQKGNRKRVFCCWKKALGFGAISTELELYKMRGAEAWISAPGTEGPSFQTSNFGRSVAFHQEIGGLLPIVRRGTA